MDGICERCSVRTVALHRYYESNIPIEYWNLSMKDFKGPEVFNKFYWDSRKHLQDIYNDGLNFSLLGPHGIGKTTVGTAILKYAATKNYNCLYTTLTDIVNVIVEAPFEEKYAAKKELVQVDLLMIDELDNRFIGNSENSIELFGKSLESIIRTRFANKLPNIFVSNSPSMLEGFNGNFKASLSSLMTNVKELAAMGKDYRKINNKQI